MDTLLFYLEFIACNFNAYVETTQLEYHKMARFLPNKKNWFEHLVEGSSDLFWGTRSARISSESMRINNENLIEYYERRDSLQQEMQTLQMKLQALMQQRNFEFQFEQGYLNRQFQVQQGELNRKLQAELGIINRLFQAQGRTFILARILICCCQRALSKMGGRTESGKDRKRNDRRV